MVSGTTLRVYRTAFHGVSQLQQRERHSQGAYRRRPAALETQENDRDGSTRITGNSLHVHGFQAVDPGKIYMPANQIREISARARVFRELRARALQAPRGI